MFRYDKLAIQRENYSLISGEKVYLTPEVIAENIPCHLSVNLNNAIKINGAPYLIAEFKLFLNSNLEIDIKENDKLTVITEKGQIYELYAGEIKIYNQTTQIKCRQEKIIEG